MRRRDVLISGGSMLLVPRSVGAGTLKTIGYLNPLDPQSFADLVAVFQRGVASMGFEIGGNVRIEYRWARGNNNALADLARELVAMDVDVIATNGAPAAFAAQKVTNKIPIVFRFGGDPVLSGLVDSLNSPGKNITGATSLNVEVISKRVEMLSLLVPNMRKVAYLVDSSTGDYAYNSSHILSQSAISLRLEPIIIRVSSRSEFEGAFERASLDADGLVVSNDSLFRAQLELLAALSLKSRMPAVSGFVGFAENGGLLSYSGSFTEQHRIMGVLVARILKGEQPRDLPILQASELELIINASTARKLGLELPLPLLARANRVIE